MRLALLFSLLWAAPVLSQDIVALFAAVPDKYLEPLTNATGKPLPAARRTAIAEAAPERRAGVARADGLRDVVIDRSGGYLRLASDTDGEGVVLEATYWKQKDGARLLALAISSWTMSTEATEAVRFLRFNGPRCDDVTAATLPDLRISRFYAKRGPAVTAAERAGLVWRWTLPRKGTTILIEAPTLDDEPGMPAGGKPDFAFEMRWQGNGFESVRIPAPAEQIGRPSCRERV